MKLQEAIAPAAEATRQKIQDLTRFAKLERVLAGICALTPVLLIRADESPIRDSISAYYNIVENQWFYVPLTMAAMLFLVNGVVKNRKLYNTYLGVTLVGVLLFNRDDYGVLHIVFTALFFGGNVLVILFYSTIKESWFKIVMVVVIAASMAAWYFLDAFTLFWAEWVSLGIIALHYILVSFLDGEKAQPAKPLARAA